MKRLNLGCGKDIRAGWINLDRADLPGVDIRHDLSLGALPFGDNEFDVVLARDVFEHLEYIPLLKEVHRILKPGGRVEIQVPHFSSANNFVDPTHRRMFSVRTFSFFVSESGTEREYYFDFAFSEISAKRIEFAKGVLIWDYALEPLINVNESTQKYYEMTGLCALFPAQSVKVTLIK